eukprot:COSAG02_NODE_59651_length_273_cov_1.471264_1_plen_58_part_01
MLRKFSCEIVDASLRLMLTKHENDGTCFLVLISVVSANGGSCSERRQICRRVVVTRAA